MNNTIKTLAPGALSIFLLLPASSQKLPRVEAEKRENLASARRYSQGGDRARFSGKPRAFQESTRN